MISRRQFLSKSACAMAGSLTLASVARAKTKRPNVVLILTDDQGSVDVNCYGAKDLITPNMDDLAKRGTRFTQYYANSCICSPSRAALLTGRFPHRAQLPGNASKGKGMPASQFTMAEMFKENGYKTAIFGKWHLGTSLPISPNEQGFDEFLGHKEGCIDNYSHFFYWNGPNRHDLWDNETETWESGTYFPDICVREAKRFLEENKDNPFFLYLPFNLPHYPLQAQRKFVEMYDHITDPKRKRYAAFVSVVDDRIGQVMAKLDELGLRENTIVIFFSDQGHSVEERTFGGGGSAGPYRGHKQTLWEGGVRVPCIVSWPGHIPQQEVRDQLTCAFDWFPTLADYCDIQLPERIIDGKSIRKIIDSDHAKSPHDVMHWWKGDMWAVRKGSWKLVYDKELFLSNLDDDISESNNLVDEYPEKLKELKQLHEEWAENVGNQS